MAAVVVEADDVLVVVVWLLFVSSTASSSSVSLRYKTESRVPPIKYRMMSDKLTMP